MATETLLDHAREELARCVRAREQAERRVAELEAASDQADHDWQRALNDLPPEYRDDGLLSGILRIGTDLYALRAQVATLEMQCREERRTGLLHRDQVATLTAWRAGAESILARDLKLLREEGYNAQTLGAIEKLLAGEVLSGLPEIETLRTQLATAHSQRSADQHSIDHLGKQLTAATEEAARLTTQVETLTRERDEWKTTALDCDRQSETWKKRFIDVCESSREKALREALEDVKRRAALPITANVSGHPGTKDSLQAAIESCVKQAIDYVTEPARAALASEAAGTGPAAPTTYLEGLVQFHTDQKGEEEPESCRCSCHTSDCGLTAECCGECCVAAPAPETTKTETKGDDR